MYPVFDRRDLRSPDQMTRVRAILQMANFRFVRPLEAPVFTPTAEEFKDPLAYLNKIRPLAERAGICKIKPPSCWQPPFAVDVDCFKFTPRIQRLNELEAKTRIKLNFLDQIAKFWELQGSSLKIPIIDKKALDLYSLHKLVQSDGGHDKVNNDKKWNRLATRMGYCPTKNYGPILKSHYDKILYPFDLFQNNKPVNSTEKEKVKEETEKEKEKEPVTPTKKGSPMKSKPSPIKGKNSPSRIGNKTKSELEPSDDDDATGIEPASKELRRLAFYGAGPKMAGFNIKSSQNLQLKQDLNGRKTKTPSMHDPLSKYVCLRCKKGDSEHCMLLCDGCDDSYHTFCLLPPLPEVPKGEWRCPQCVAEEVSKPSEAFGFEQAQHEYTLQQFGEMADRFKSEYFNTPVHRVESEVIEREFWRIVSAIDEDVTVQYGADLHTMDHGSGFPTPGSSNILPGDEPYIKSGWNLNNLPVLAGSVLGHINADISGMKVPWMYVGMCFATFCWHNEDHWSYSINYLHWGEPKTWYGVPGYRADDFENAMKTAAPELFQSQPDLLHQLVTIMNPNILMKAGVPVYRMDQRAGEFIVTFPRAYHAGFNQGYNFAEAVNFAPPDWLAMGRSCIEHYSTLHRYCVFAHDELVCKMSTEATDLTLMVAMATYKDMLTMCASEKELRKAVNNWGVTRCERKAYELLPDDERLCDFCKTTCFLSAITCTCTTRLACLRHYDKLCDCPPSEHTLMYRYTMDEIPVMMRKLKERTLDYENWVERLELLLVMCPGRKIELEDIKEFLVEAETKGFPKTPLRDAAEKMVDDAEKCILVAQKLCNPAIKTRTKNLEEARPRLRISELEMFVDQMNTLAVRIKEAVQVRQLLQKVRIFRSKAKELLGQSEPNIDELKAILNEGVSFDIDLPQVAMLSNCLDRTKWIQEVDDTFESDAVWTLDYVNKTIYTGEALEKMDIVEIRLCNLRRLRKLLISFEDKASRLLGEEEHTPIKSFEDLLTEGKNLNVTSPSIPTVKNIIKKAKEYASELNCTYEDCLLDTIDYLRARVQTQATQNIEMEADDDEDSDQDLDLEEKGSSSKRKNMKSSQGPAAKNRRVSTDKERKTRKRKAGGNNLEENTEPCAAKPCKNPSGKEVNWILCDVCDLWYHFACIGAKKSVVNKISSFECNQCKANKSTKDGSDDNSVGSCDKGSVSSSNKENSESKKSPQSDSKNSENEETEKDSSSPRTSFSGVEIKNVKEEIQDTQDSEDSIEPLEPLQPRSISLSANSGDIVYDEVEVKRAIGEDVKETQADVKCSASESNQDGSDSIPAPSAVS